MSRQIPLRNDVIIVAALAALAVGLPVLGRSLWPR